MSEVMTRPRRARLPPHKLRSATLAFTLTAAGRSFLDDEARRRGVSICRLVGDVMDAIIADNLFAAILER